MGGLGAALRPVPVPVLEGFEQDAALAGWRGAAPAATTRPGSGRLLVGDADCPCDRAERQALVAWAQDAALAVVVVPGRDGVAVEASDGRIRYAGAASAITAQCGGRTGFEGWLRGDDARAWASLACPCRSA